MSNPMRPNGSQDTLGTYNSHYHPDSDPESDEWDWGKIVRYFTLLKYALSVDTSAGGPLQIPPRALGDWGDALLPASERHSARAVDALCQPAVRMADMAILEAAIAMAVAKDEAMAERIKGLAGLKTDLYLNQLQSEYNRMAAPRGKLPTQIMVAKHAHVWREALGIESDVTLPYYSSTSGFIVGLPHDHLLTAFAEGSEGTEEDDGDDDDDADDNNNNNDDDEDDTQHGPNQQAPVIDALEGFQNEEELVFEKAAPASRSSPWYGPFKGLAMLVKQFTPAPRPPRVASASRGPTVAPTPGFMTPAGQVGEPFDMFLLSSSVGEAQLCSQHLWRKAFEEVAEKANVTIGPVEENFMKLLAENTTATIREHVKRASG
ncbi:hypothetical protein FA13DRAFT_1713878 [Coprinellus micaceus]|uniref:Uncharacterized protein n=1 Tax=Coprinellus micaceus TaxID=71717 RepID=A0A4Y7SV98_COPMI|nr:hypothetical protein FA13DRAFT_1713878 [Coprinellus micaceus]